MTNLERLIEAVEYSIEEEIEWFETFDSIKEAKKIFRAAKRETPTDDQIVYLISLMDEDFFDSYTAEETYVSILDKLEEILIDNI